MGSMTKDTYKTLYEYGKSVFRGEMTIKDASKKASTQNPEVAESSAEHYINWYSRMREGKFLSWNSNSDLLEYYVERIISEEDESAGELAIKAVRQYALYKNRTEFDNKLIQMAKQKNIKLLELDPIDNNPSFQIDNKEWMPKIEDYDPKITKDKWYGLICDRMIFDDKSLLAMACMVDNGGLGSSMELSKKYNYNLELWNITCGVDLAKRIADATNCPVMRDHNKAMYFCIPFLYKKANLGGMDIFVYKLRPELENALKEYGIEKYLVIGGMNTELTVKGSIEQIKKYIAAKGFSYNDGLIEDFYLSLKSKPFVILAGTSGTGKTRLVKLFAGAVGAYAKESGGNGRFKLVSVRPDWSDSTDLFGHTDLNGNYIAGAIIDFVKEAKENRDYPYFLCLDEMNLSRVEYYLSDFLSLIETRTNVNGEIKTYKLTLDKAAEKDYPDLYIPENLYVIGTVNMDETTFPFSKKVLDRANTIEFSYVDLIPSFSSDAEAVAPLNKGNDFFKSQYLVLGTDVKPEQQELARRVSVDLQSINKVLQQANAHVGYRVRDEIVFYMLNNDTAKLLDYDTAFDYEIMQKILPRIQGSSEGIKNMMCDLFKMFAGDYSGFSQSYIWKQMDDYINKKSCKYTNSAKKLCYMMRRFEEDGFTSYWL